MRNRRAVDSTTHTARCLAAMPSNMRSSGPVSTPMKSRTYTSAARSRRGDRAQYCAVFRDPRRLPRIDGRNDNQPLLLVGLAGDRQRCPAGHDTGYAGCDWRRSRSISLVQMGGLNTRNITEEGLLACKPELWMSMIETAEIVAERYGISRERQDEYALESQRRTAAAQAANRFRTRSYRSPPG